MTSTIGMEACAHLTYGVPAQRRLAWLEDEERAVGTVEAEGEGQERGS